MTTPKVDQDAIEEGYVHLAELAPQDRPPRVSWIERLRTIQTIDQVEQLDLHASAGSDLVPAPGCPVGCVRTPLSSNRAC
jgi:hypothetical protein